MKSGLGLFLLPVVCRKHRNRRGRRDVIPLSANEVGGEGQGEVELLPGCPSPRSHPEAKWSEGNKFSAASRWFLQNALAILIGYGSITPLTARTWTQTGSPTNNAWISLVSSADGARLAAVSAFSVFISTNAGSTWITSSPPAFVWQAIASS